MLAAHNPVREVLRTHLLPQVSPHQRHAHEPPVHAGHAEVLHATNSTDKPIRTWSIIKNKINTDQINKKTANTIPDTCAHAGGCGGATQLRDRNSSELFVRPGESFERRAKTPSYGMEPGPQSHDGGQARLERHRDPSGLCGNYRGIKSTKNKERNHVLQIWRFSLHVIGNWHVGGKHTITR